MCYELDEVQIRRADYAIISIDAVAFYSKGMRIPASDQSSVHIMQRLFRPEFNAGNAYEKSWFRLKLFTIVFR